MREERRREVVKSGQKWSKVVNVLFFLLTQKEEKCTDKDSGA